MTPKKQKSPSELAHEYRLNGDPTAWFELIYAASNTSGNGVPWAKMSANPFLLEWLEQSGTPAAGKSALVVGCGMGDDAEALAKHGYTVTAFDIAASAIALCQQRFPDSEVNYQVADLFNAPEEWQAGFDLVFENITVQAMPPEMQASAIQHITPLVAANGQLLVITMARPPEQAPNGPPWPLARITLDDYTADGLGEVFLHQNSLQANPLIWRIQALYSRELRSGTSTSKF